MRGLIRVGLAGVVVSGAVMTASPADAAPGRETTAGVVRESAAGENRTGPAPEPRR